MPLSILQLQILYTIFGISFALGALLMFYYEKGQIPYRVGNFSNSAIFLVAVVIALAMHEYYYIPQRYIIEVAVPFIPAFIATTFIWCIIRHIAKKHSVEFDKVSDIRNMKMPKSLFTFDVFSYWSSNKIFVGLNADTQKPLYLPMKEFDETHVQITGSTGSGKTVFVQMLARQLIRRKRPFIVMDPKKDKFLMHVLFWAARKAGVPYHYVDLNKGPQINPFIDTPKDEMVELMYAAFGISNKGTDADHYRGKDRKGARLAAKLMLDTPSMRGVMDEVINPDLFPEGFCDRFSELADLESINANDQGVDFESIVNKAGVLYVVGATDNSQVKAAMDLLTAKIIHMIKRRNPAKRYPRAHIFFDEFKFSCSKSAMTVFSTMRDKGLTAIMAHQSNMDFYDIPGIDPMSVHGGVVDNANIKIVYKVKHPDTVRGYADMSGFKTVVSGTKKAGEKKTTYTETSTNLIEPNHILRLGKGLAVCYGVADIATIIGTSPQKTKHHKKALLINELQLAETSFESTPAVKEPPNVVTIDDFIKRNKV